MSEHHLSGPSIEDRLRSLELALSESRPARRQPVRQPRGLRRSLTIVATIVAVVVLPMAAFASDDFSDVPPGGFHDAIGQVFDARITNGCTATAFCPGATVTRGQMAAFLSRGLPRATAIEDFTIITADNSGIDVATVTIQTGGVAGGTGYVVVTGSVNASTTSSTTCPCEVGVFVRNTGNSDAPAFAQFFDVLNTPAPSGFRDASGTMSWVFDVATGTSATFAVQASVDMTGGASPSLTLVGHISAVYVPFGSAGSFPALAESAGEATQGGRPD